MKHFREPATVLDKLVSADGLYLPRSRPCELYHGAYRSNRRETSLARIERFLDAVILLAPDKETAFFTGRSRPSLAQVGTPIP